MLMFPTKCSFWSTNLSLLTCLNDIPESRSTKVISRVNHKYYGSNHSTTTCIRGGGLISKAKYAKDDRLGFLDVINEDRANGLKVNEISCPCFNKSHELDHHDVGVGDDYDDVDASIWGTLMKDDEGSFYRQPFVIRCYEIGPDKSITLETLISLLQEAGINHVKSLGLTREDEFTASPVMSLFNLVWIICHIHVHVYKPSFWGNKVEVDAWSALHKNSLRRDWIVRDYRTKQIIAKTTSKWMLMKMETRKFSKMPEEVRREWAIIDSSRYAFENQDVDHHNGIEKSSMPTDGTADLIVSGFTPRWQDMDGNMHVNYTKYIRWIMESVPMGLSRSHISTSITLEYRRECRQDDVCECLTSVKPLTNLNRSMDITRAIDIESTHLLRRQTDKADIVRAKITWRSKTKALNNEKSTVQEVHSKHD
ncbi:Palmitoyl-acyl carrier protein thioesterase, chloroplastic-like protein [Drosera capensis]